LLLGIPRTGDFPYRISKAVRDKCPGNLNVGAGCGQAFNGRLFLKSQMKTRQLSPLWTKLKKLSMSPLGTLSHFGYGVRKKEIRCSALVKEDRALCSKLSKVRDRPRIPTLSSHLGALCGLASKTLLLQFWRHQEHGRINRQLLCR